MANFEDYADTEGFLVLWPNGYEKNWNDGRNVSGIAAFYLEEQRQRRRACRLQFIPAAGAKLFEALRLLEIPVTSVDPATLETLCRQHGYELVTFDWE